MPVRTLETKLHELMAQRAANPLPPRCHICMRQLEKWGVEDVSRQHVIVFGECTNCNMADRLKVDMLDTKWADQPGAWDRLNRIIGYHQWMLPTTERA